jgi:hypothetical protein
MAVSSEFNDEVSKVVDLLKYQSVMFAEGLSDKEVASCEERFEIKFPPDLRAFLQYALPVGFLESERDCFPNWRSGDEGKLRERLEWPWEGMVFDIENNAFWLDQWGPKPTDLSDALAVARQHFQDKPKLIPVYVHRYLPQEPCTAGNPVFSVYQTDIIYYGENLWNYFEHEFGMNEGNWFAKYEGWTAEQYQAAHRSIRFWSGLVS